MKLKMLILGLCINFCSSVFASAPYLNPHANNLDNQSTAKSVSAAGDCDIEIINNSFDDVRVYGVYDDGVGVSYNVYSWGSPQRIPLYYYGYCHSGMDLYISAFNGAPIYSGYTERGTTIRIVPYLKNQLKIEKSAR